MPIAVKRYTSTMTGSPSLTGQAGSLVALLSACLVDGFNPRTVTSATQSGGVATITTSTAHGYAANDVIALSGANESAWNNEFRVVTALTATTFTVAIAANAPSPATGTLAAKIAPLGWTRPFSGSGKAVYLPQPQYVQCYLRVLDDATTPTSAAGRWAKWRGYESMTDVDTGAGLFPTVAQVANALSCVKSNTSDATARAWWLAGDGGIFYFGTFWYAGHTGASGYLFGDVQSLRTGDAFASMIAGEVGDALPAGFPGGTFATLAGLGSTQAGKYLARAQTQIGSAVAAGMMGDQGISPSMGGSGLPFPYPLNNGLLLASVACTETSVVRGLALPGLYQPLHAAPLAHLDVVPDFAGLPGRVLQAFDLGYGSVRGQCLIDITGPWR